MKSRGLFLSLGILAFANIGVFVQSAINKLGEPRGNLMLNECSFKPFDESPVAFVYNLEWDAVDKNAWRERFVSAPEGSSARVWVGFIGSATPRNGDYLRMVVDTKQALEARSDVAAVVRGMVAWDKTDGVDLKPLVDRLHIARVHRRRLRDLDPQPTATCEPRFDVDIVYGRFHHPYIRTLRWRE